MNREIVVIAHDIRSCHNIGSIFRTAEGLGVAKLYLSGYTPYPNHEGDSRLPHDSKKISKQINKTALGAEEFIDWEHSDLKITDLIKGLKKSGYEICALEQTSSSIGINEYLPPQKVAVVIGREVEGIEDSILEACDVSVEIPMFGKKESLNVVQATAIILYRLRFLPT